MDKHGSCEYLCERSIVAACLQRIVRWTGMNQVLQGIYHELQGTGNWSAREHRARRFENGQDEVHMRRIRETMGNGVCLNRGGKTDECRLTRS